VIPQTRAELLKVRSTRTTMGLAVGMVALVLLFVLLNGFLTKVAEISSVADQRSMFGIGSFSGVFSALAGILLVTSEFRFGTIRPTFLFEPRRTRVVAAKAGAGLVAGLVFGIVGAGIAIGVGSAILASRYISVSLDGGDFALLAFGIVAGAGLWGTIGVGVGSVIRNQVGAIIGLLAWGFVVENLLFALVPSVGRLTPGQAQNGLMGQTDDPHLLHPLPAVLVMLAWTAVIAVAGAMLTARRDVD
jgi:ABC-2 type transport system permease protein